MTKALTSFTAATVVAASLLANAPAFAGPANHLKDLIGAKGSSGESELQARGYSYVSGTTKDNKVNTFWWNAQNQNCIRVTTKDGRYSNIDDVRNDRCGQAAGGSGAAQPARISDLKGMDSIKAFDVMTSRGFNGVDTITTGNTIYGIYYNPSTKQCIQLTNADNRVVSADDIQTHPKCR
jgi:hypothetical protein